MKSLRNHWKRLLVLGVFAFVIMGADASCQGGNNNSVQADQQTTNTQMDQYQKVQPVPVYDWSAMRQSMISVLNAQVHPTNTWSVEVAYTGQAIFMCPSIGYPIPATDELTNPQQVVQVNTGGSSWPSGVVDQADPNGVYGGNTAGTYIICVGPDGKLTPVYSEPDVNVFPFPVSIVDGKIVTDPNGKSSISVDMSGQNATPAPSAK